MIRRLPQSLSARAKTVSRWRRLFIPRLPHWALTDSQHALLFSKSDTQNLHKGTSSWEWRGWWGYRRADGRSVGCLKSSYTKISDMKRNQIQIYGPIKIITNINTLEWFATSLLRVKECYTHYSQSFSKYISLWPSWWWWLGEWVILDTRIFDGRY